MARLLGRNRPRTDRAHDGPALSPWAAVAVSTVLASVLLLLATGVAAEARYARLAAAVLLGTGLLAAVTVAAVRCTPGGPRRRVDLGLSPWLLVAAVSAAACTRVADLSPAVAVGVLLAATVRAAAPADAAALLARIAAWRSTGLLLLAVAGWVAHSLLPGTGLWGAFAAETAITLCIGGTGSLVVGLVPVPGSDAAALWGRYRTRAVVLAAAACVLVAAVSSGPDGRGLPPLGVVVAAVVSVAVAAVVAWHRRRPARTT